MNNPIKQKLHLINSLNKFKTYPKLNFETSEVNPIYSDASDFNTSIINEQLFDDEIYILKESLKIYRKQKENLIKTQYIRNYLAP